MDLQMALMMGLYSDHGMVNLKDGLMDRLRVKHSGLSMVIQKVLGTDLLKGRSKVIPRG